jgi:hypothetical protein
MREAEQGSGVVMTGSDVHLYCDGSMVGLSPMSSAAQEWFAENVQSEPWQWLGPTLWIDQRMAPTLVEAIIGQGFQLS